MIDTLLSWLAPHSCYGCGEMGNVLCHYCTNDIIEEPFGQCIFCTKPTTQQALCASCRERTGIETAWCVAARRGPLKKALDAYKFERVMAASKDFVYLLDGVVPALSQDWVVTAIPTAPAHIRERGYAHAERVASDFAKKRQLPYRQLLDRHTSATQHFANKKDRRRFAESAFTVHGAAESVILFDDIVTTGATLEAAVKRLKENGTKRISVMVLARQPLDDSVDL